METYGTVTLHNADCHELLKTFGDKEFDLAICDPPYGTMGKSIETGQISKGKDSTKFTPKTWDTKPFPRSFFVELFRVAKHWILWGAQHYADNIPSPHAHSCEIIWDKGFYCGFADTENAWTNFKTANRIFSYVWRGFRQGKFLGGDKNSKEFFLKETRLHPTQKPIALYEWLLAKYAGPGFKILDPTAGAGACGIACLRAGLECTLIEQDDEYCGFIRNRLGNEIVKPTLFETAEIQAQIWGE
jgi:site-specific DNA-methyltransferase (adenine-specific)